MLPLIPVVARSVFGAVVVVRTPVVAEPGDVVVVAAAAPGVPGAVVVVAPGAPAMVVVVEAVAPGVPAIVVVVVVAPAIVVVVVVGVVPPLQTGTVITFLSSVTAPFRANSRPSTFARLAAVMEVKAKIVPTKVEDVPKVAELPTCQKTLQGSASLIRTTELDDAVIKVLAA